MKVFIGGFCTETNTFAPIPTGESNFFDDVFRRKDASLDDSAPWTAAQRVWRASAEKKNLEVFESINAFAQPAGVTVKSVYEKLRNLLLDDLKTISNVDMVLLFMHGAMVAEGYDDCEGDTIARVREIVGKDAIIAVELDLHCHLTEKMINSSDIIITFKEYPHVDIADRAEELFEIAYKSALRQIKPTMAYSDTHMVSMWRTSQPQVRKFINRMKEIEKQDGIMSVSLAHGFPWGDVEDVGARTLVVADTETALAQEIADKLAVEFWELRHQTATKYSSISEAIDGALQQRGPVILADVADNAGGGAASDSSFILKELISRGIRSCVLGYVWDPNLVEICLAAGEGAEFEMRLCGKVGVSSGAPIDLKAMVKKVIINHSQTGLGGTPSPLGNSVWISNNDIDIILISDRNQPINQDGFEKFGIDLEKKKIVVLKSTQHFYGAFRNLTENIYYVNTPGAIEPDFAKIPLSKRKSKWWPKDEQAFGP